MQETLHARSFGGLTLPRISVDSPFRTRTQCDICDRVVPCHIGFAQLHDQWVAVLATCCRCSGCSHIEAKFNLWWGTITGKVSLHRAEFRPAYSFTFVRSVARYLHREKAA